MRTCVCTFSRPFARWLVPLLVRCSTPERDCLFACLLSFRAGQGYLLQGDRSSIQAAQSQFAEALQLDPTNKQAKKGAQEARAALRRIDYPSSSEDDDDEE